MFKTQGSVSVSPADFLAEKQTMKNSSKLQIANTFFGIKKLCSHVDSYEDQLFSKCLHTSNFLYENLQMINKHNLSILSGLEMKLLKQ